MKYWELFGADLKAGRSYGSRMPEFRSVPVVLWRFRMGRAVVESRATMWGPSAGGFMGHGEKYRFGPFEVHPGARELSKSGTKIKLRGQPYLILEVLLSRAGEVVTREEIREKLWPADTFVDFEHGLNTSVKKLRQVLCDSAEEPRYIETVPRLGYRFIAPVELVTETLKPPASSACG